MAIKNPEKLHKLNPYFKNLIILLAKRLEEHYGIDVYITSGYRTKEENKKLGGVKNSAHLYGLAVDIRARSGFERFVIIKEAFEIGIPRIGVYNNHIHLDVDTSKPFPVVWSGKSR